MQKQGSKNRAHPEVRKVFGDAAVVQKDKRKRQVIFGQFLIVNMRGDCLIVGYLGPRGTFSQQAALEMHMNLGCQVEYRAFNDIGDVFLAVSNGECDAGVVPIENSTEGPVNATLDALLREDGINITALMNMPISHMLMGDGPNPGILEDPDDEPNSRILEDASALSELGDLEDAIASVKSSVQKILAHPQALAQCRGYIKARYPDALLVNTASNGEAALLVSEEIKNQKKCNWVAIGPEAAAKEYDLHIWDRDIQDESVNSTAFVQIKRKSGLEDILPDCRISIVFSVENRPGTLCQILGIFDAYGINMINILSRPMPGVPGEYVFYVDIDGYREDNIHIALKKMQNEAILFKLLGSYPVLKNKSL